MRAFVATVALCALALSACNHRAPAQARSATAAAAQQDACARLAGAWTADNVGNRIQVDVHRRNNMIVWHQFVFLGNTDATEESTFFGSCANGDMKTGTYWGDAVYDKHTDTVVMHGRAFSRAS